MLAMTGFYYFSLLSLIGLSVLTDHHWFVSLLTSTTYLCWSCHSPSLDKEDYFVFLFVVALLPATLWVLFLFPSFMAYTQWLQLILTSFRQYVIPAGHFPQKSRSRNPRICFPLSPLPDHTLLPMTHDPPPPVLAGYRLVKSRPCMCSTSACVQNLPAAFAVVWRLLCTFCRPSLTSYGVSCFLISLSLWFAPLRGYVLFDCGVFLLQPTLLLLSVFLLPFPVALFCHSCCDVI